MLTDTFTVQMLQPLWPHFTATDVVASYRGCHQSSLTERKTWSHTDTHIFRMYADVASALRKCNDYGSVMWCCEGCAAGKDICRVKSRHRRPSGSRSGLKSGNVSSENVQRKSQPVFRCACVCNFVQADFQKKKKKKKRQEKCNQSRFPRLSCEKV